MYLLGGAVVLGLLVLLNKRVNHLNRQFDRQAHIDRLKLVAGLVTTALSFIIPLLLR
jgi:uncharacterized membrane protein YqgA involved in biofilm formation